MNTLAILFIRVYQNSLSKLLPGRCRFYPSCSEYSVECFQTFPFFKALYKSAFRIIRCNPLFEGYFDPVIPEGQKPEMQTLHIHRNKIK